MYFSFSLSVNFLGMFVVSVALTVDELSAAVRCIKTKPDARFRLNFCVHGAVGLRVFHI